MTQAKWSFEVHRIGIDKNGGLVICFSSSGQLRGLAVLSERHFGVTTNLKCTTKCSIALSDRQLRMGHQKSGARRFVFLPNNPVFEMSHCCLCRDRIGVVEVVNSGRALISSQPLAPSPFVRQFSRREAGLFSAVTYVRLSTSLFIGCMNCPYITEGVLHYLIHCGSH